MKVYAIINDVNGKTYVGQTCGPLFARFQNHVASALAHRGCPVLGAAIRKYGSQHFHIHSLISVKRKEELDYWEKLFIAYFETNITGYNIAPGGEGGSVPGRTLSVEAKEKIRQRAIGRQISETTKKKMSKSHLGRPKSGEHKANISAALLGRNFSENHKANLSQSHLGHIPWNKGKKKCV